MELINKTESVQHHDHPEEEDRDIYQVFSYFDAGFGLLSIVIFFADVVTDIQLANDYFHKGNMFAFIFTTVFISLPAVITFILNVRWYVLDYRISRDDKYRTPLSLWLTRFTFTILLMGSVIRYVLNLNRQMQLYPRETFRIIYDTHALSNFRFSLLEDYIKIISHV